MIYDDDIPTGYGSLGGAGAERHDAVKTKLSDDGSGITNNLSCDRCGKGLQVSVPWTELIYMARSRVPSNGAFKHDAYHGCFLVNAECPVCRDPVRLGFTPDECARHLKSGIAAGKVNPQQIVQYELQQGLVPR